MAYALCNLQKHDNSSIVFQRAPMERSLLQRRPCTLIVSTPLVRRAIDCVPVILERCHAKDASTGTRRGKIPFKAALKKNTFPLRKGREASLPM